MKNIKPYLNIKNYFNHSDLIKTVPIFVICLLIIVITNFFGFILPPFSILAIPFTVSSLTVLVLFSGKYWLVLKTIIISILIVVNDLLIRTFAGGTHDAEGNGFIILFTYIALFFVPFFVVAYGVFRKDVFGTIFGLIFLIFIIYFYLMFFSAFGLTFSQSISENIEKSKEKNVFVCELGFNGKQIITETDTFHIKNGWIENKINFIDYGFFNKFYKNSHNYVVLNIEGDFQ